VQTKDEKNVVIAFHETNPSPFPENLKKYLLENYKVNLLFQTHPLLEIKESFKLSSKYEYFESSKLKAKSEAYHWQLPVLLLFVKDIIYSLIWSLKFSKKWDLFYGADSLNALVGIFLREIGLVKKVVYYCMDYYPVRFKNPVLNWAYFQIDGFCAKYADETWSVTQAIIDARKKKMGWKKNLKNQFVVPGGIWFYKAKRKPFDKIDKKKLIYRGSLPDFMGVDLVIRALPELTKKMPDISFEVLGGGEELVDLKKLAKNLKVEKRVKFHGWVKDRQELERIIGSGAIGVATFNTNILDKKIAVADPGKIKDYMLMGLPIIATNAFWFWKDVKEKKVGIIIDYNIDSFVNAVLKLLQNQKLLRQYREDALKFIEPLDWENIFKKNLPRVLN